MVLNEIVLALICFSLWFISVQNYLVLVFTLLDVNLCLLLTLCDVSLCVYIIVPVVSQLLERAGARGTKLKETQQQLLNLADSVEEMLAQLTEYQALLATKESDPIPHDINVVEELLKEHQVSSSDPIPAPGQQ